MLQVGCVPEQMLRVQGRHLLLGRLPGGGLDQEGSQVDLQGDEKNRAWKAAFFKNAKQNIDADRCN